MRKYNDPSHPPRIRRHHYITRNHRLWFALTIMRFHRSFVRMVTDMLMIEFKPKLNRYIIKANRRKYRLTFIFNSYLETKNFIDTWYENPFRARFNYVAKNGKQHTLH